MLIDGIFNATCVAINVAVRIGWRAGSLVDDIAGVFGK